jgi:transcription elongation factor Elf1
MAVCAACGQDCVLRARSLWDADGEPHKPNCPMGGMGKMVVEAHCEFCGKGTRQEQTLKRRRRHRKCLNCGREYDIRETAGRR